MKTPKPLRYRHDGWTPEREAAFLKALAETRRVLVAAAVVGMSAGGAYRHRRHPAAAAFAAAWDRALAPVTRPPRPPGLLERALGRMRAGEVVPTAWLVRLLPRLGTQDARREARETANSLAFVNFQDSDGPGQRDRRRPRNTAGSVNL